MVYYLKNTAISVVSSQSSYLVTIPGRDPLIFEEEEGAAIHRILQTTTNPTPQGALLQQTSLETLALLVELGVLFEGTSEELSTLTNQPNKPCKHLVVGVSGSISCAAALPLCLQLARSFCERLDVIFTEAALKFIRAESFQYRGIHAWTDAFTATPEANVPHMYLASSAEMVLILPASANTLFKLANGACSDLLSLVVSATKAPVVVAPAMNLAMLTNPAIRRNIDQLRGDGVYIIESSSGVPVSKGINGEAESSGSLGVNELTITATLEAILALHRQRSEPTHE